MRKNINSLGGLVVMVNVVLVDKSDNQTGTEEKITAHEQAKLHRAFSIFVFNSNNELMLQKRIKAKYHSGSLWTNTCCGHPMPGEIVSDAAHRRLQEEMGFDCELKEEFSFIYEVKLDYGLTEHEFDHVFIGKFDGQPMLNPKEAEDWKWVSSEEIEKDVKKHPDVYTSWFLIALPKVLEPAGKSKASGFFSYQYREDIENELKKFLPDQLDNDWAKKATGNARWKQDMESMTAAISIPVWDFLNRGGKRWRPMLMLICSEAVGGQPKEVLPFTPIPELIHNGTLIIDDIEDNSDLRRGKTVLHKIYGVDIAVNAGNALYLLPFNLIRDSNLSDKAKASAYSIISTQLLKCHFGQAVDIYWHSGKSKSFPDEEHYFQMCANKTGSVAAMAAKLGALLGNGSETQIEVLGRFAETAGVVFQIQDDILNLSEKDNLGKGFGDDICEGKKSLLVIYTIRTALPTDRMRLVEILGMHTKDKNLQKEAIAIINKNNSVEYATKIAGELAEKAWKEAESVIPETEAKMKLRELAELMLNRTV
jgi:geranylgeranyl diphosphate synthase, type I